MFKRTQQSGAIVGGVNAIEVSNFSYEIRRSLVGDVYPSNESDTGVDFLWSVECKFYKDVLTIENLVAGDKKNLIPVWMQESIVDAVKVDKKPILIFKFNRTSVYVAITPNENYPENVPFITLRDGIKVALLDDLLPHRDFWIAVKET